MWDWGDSSVGNALTSKQEDQMLGSLCMYSRMHLNPSLEARVEGVGWE